MRRSLEIQSDGQKQLESYSQTLSCSKAYFQALIASSSSKSWKPIPIPPTLATPPPPTSSSSSSTSKGKEPASSSSPPNVVVHRKSVKGGEVFRATVEVPVGASGDGAWTVEGFRAVLATAEARSGWDRMVEGAQTVELIDEDTRIVKTKYRLGWPSSPRDTITISQTSSDADTIINISTSLPRSPDEPAFLRPAPPYVRAHVSLLAFCIQLPTSPTTTTTYTSLPSSHLSSSSSPSPRDPTAVASSSSSTTPPPSNPNSTSSNRLRITCFWQWDPKGSWAVGSGIGLHIPPLLTGLLDHAREYSDKIPLLTSFGKGVSLSSTSFDTGRDTLNLDYSIVVEEEELLLPPAVSAGAGEGEGGEVVSLKGDQESRIVAAAKEEKKGVERTLEFAIPPNQGWRIQVTVKSLVPEDDTAPRWVASLGRRTPSPPSSLPSAPPPRLLLRISHPPLPDPTQLFRIKLSISRDTSTKLIRLNGVPQPIVDLVPEPSSLQSSNSKRLSDQLVPGGSRGGDTASLSGISMRTIESISSVASSYDSRQAVGGGTDGEAGAEAGGRLKGDRSEKAERSVLSLIRRNYIYFTSLLQEPEAKWRPILEAGRGVSIHQLDSIDRTLVVYRAEAVFVGVGIWDLLAVISSPGARLAWDKSYEDAVLMDDVNELSEVWWWKSKAAWPVAARDSVQLKTTYKSPTSVHVFSFSTDDHGLFPSIPPVDPLVIRTQVDLQGWSIEALSPNTTQVTLLEQSDPKGWSSKTSIPQTMANALAGIGEFAIRSGGPPLMTRLGHAKVISSRYDLEKGTFRLEYLPAEWRRASLASGSSSLPSSANALVPSVVDEAAFVSSSKSSRTPESDDGPIPNVECELRCDSDTWASSLDIVIDPPPQSVSCLKRHRLSGGGGGSWITIEHDAVLLGEEKVLVIVRKGPPTSKEKNVVMVNGAKIKVDVEALPEEEVKTLSKQKRIKPTRIPLDQPPVLGVIRRRHGVEEPLGTPGASPTSTPDGSVTSDPLVRNMLSGASRLASPLSRFWYSAAEPAPISTITPPLEPTPLPTTPPPNTLKPMQVALDALDSVRLLHSQARDPGSWALVVDTGGFLIEKRNVPSISPAFPVHRASRVIQGSTPEDVLGVVETTGSRKLWDDRFDTIQQLESYGNGCSSSFMTARCTFPFRDRGFLVSSVTAKGIESPASTPTLSSSGTTTSSSSSSSSSGIFHVSASYPREAAVGFDGSKINPYVLPLGQQLLEGWVMETLDPYGNEQYPIPSTRCTYYSAVDYSGSIPTVVNSSINASLPRVLLGVETYLKTRRSTPLLRNPSSGLVFDPRRDNITGPSSNAVGLKVWDLVGVDEERTLLQSSFDPVEAEFKSSLFIRPTPWIDGERTGSSSSRGGLPGSWQAISGGGGPSTSASTSTSTILEEASRKASSSSLRADAQSDQLLSPSSSMPDLNKSRRTLRQSPSASSSLSRASSTTVMDLGGEARRSRRGKDFLVAEYVVDTTAFPAGYNITSSASVASTVPSLHPLPPPQTASSPVPESPTIPTSSTSTPAQPQPSPRLPLPLLPSTARENRLSLPLKIVVLPLPPPPIHAASLSSSPPRRKHLIRITLPTAQFQAPIQDPLLHEEPKPAPKKPAWLELVQEKGAIVSISVDPLAGEAYDDTEMMIVTVEGSAVEVGRVRERSSSMVSLGAGGGKGGEDEEDWSGAWPRLRRTLLPPGVPGVSAPEPPISPLPKSLASPIAIAHHLFHDPAPPSPPTINEVPPTPPPTEGEATVETVEVVNKPLEDVKSPPTLAPRKYSNPTSPLLSFFSLTRKPSTPPTPNASAASSPTTLTTLPLPSPLGTNDPTTLTTATTTGNALLPTPFLTFKALPPTFSFPTLVFVALVSFLLGSLIRSLLSPADFVVFLSPEEMGEGVREEGWRELKRLAEWRGAWKGGDLMVGWVRRGGE